MSGKEKLDFLGIGASKSGTTSLFEYMRRHPQIYIPFRKEIPYFANDEWIARGWQWYLDWLFHRAHPDLLWGTITPHYLTYIDTAKRIRATLPDVKLFALLRDPVERAYSQYQMDVRKRAMQRSFEETIHELITPTRLENSRIKPIKYNQYIVNGEYGRLLTRYYDQFRPEQIAIFFTEDLKRDPKSVLKAILQYLEIDPTFVPPNIENIYYQGGTRQRIPGLHYNSLRRKRYLQPLRPIWKALVPNETARSWLWIKLDRWNIKPDKQEDQQILPSVQKLLRQHYWQDSEMLAELIGTDVPWLSKWSAQT